MRRRSGAGLSVVLALALGLAGCKTEAEKPGHHLQIPDAVSGGTRGGGRPEGPNLERMKADDAAAEADRVKKEEEEAAADRAKADALWQSGLAKEDRRPDDAADDFQKLANDYPDHLQSGEARFREAKLRMQVGKWNASEQAIEKLLKDHPVNPHLAEVERMLYEVSLHIFEESRGLAGIFHVKKRGFDGLALLTDSFPSGTLADDAVLAVADEYMRQDDWDLAALHYDELLLRYPDSEWSFVARLRLGDAYLLRDQGTAYHAGYVEIDPRGKLDAQAKQQRPVKSCIAAALEQYQAFLDRIELDPGRRAEYASQVGYAQGKVAECRAKLAAKDRRTAAYYGSRGASSAAAVYEASARSIESGVGVLGATGANGGAAPTLAMADLPPTPRYTPAGKPDPIEPETPTEPPPPPPPAPAPAPPPAPPPAPSPEPPPAVEPVSPPQPPPRWVPTEPPPAPRPADSPAAYVPPAPPPCDPPAPATTAIRPVSRIVTGANGLPLPPSWPGGSGPSTPVPDSTPTPYVPPPVYGPQYAPPSAPSIAPSPAPPPPPAPPSGPLPPPRRLNGNGVVTNGSSR